jgi:hypothetical protein
MWCGVVWGEELGSVVFFCGVEDGGGVLYGESVVVERCSSVVTVKHIGT